MKILFVSGDAHLPQMSGGVQSSTDQLIRKFNNLGHEAVLLCALHGGNGWLEIRSRIEIKLSPSNLSSSSKLGYQIYRTWHPWKHVDEAIAIIRPDVVLIQHNRTFQFLQGFNARNVPCLVYLRNVEFEEIAGDLSEFTSTTFIANSRFTAAAYHDRYGIDCHVVPPSIDQSRYQVKVHGDKIVYINPYPVKGVDRAIEIARFCPDLPFLFVESWSLTEAYHTELKSKIGKLPNVELMRKTNDMRVVYGAARLVLAPSKWEEAWGRVASEAHVSGIPVVGSDRGGLPEAIGPGGVTLAYDAPIEQWVTVVRSIYDDSAVHSRLSQAAKIYAARDELDLDRQVTVILGLLQQAISRKAK